MRARDQRRSGVAPTTVTQPRPSPRRPGTASSPKLAAAKDEAAQQKRMDEQRKKKIDPPLQNKQNPNPPAPVQTREGSGPKSPAQKPESQPKKALRRGGKTGETADSPSSSEADPAVSESTSKRRGMRRGDPAFQKRQSGGSQSTTPGDSSPGPSASTEPTSTGGAIRKAARNSEE